MNTTTIRSQPSSQINWDKTTYDLGLIRSLQEFCQINNWRIVVSGGYGLDIFLGQITRTHNDVDIIIYGQDSREDVRPTISTFLTNLIPKASLKVSENEFMIDIDLHTPGLGANIYYVQVAENPFTTLDKVIKQNGETITNSKKRFPQPMKGKLDDLAIDVQNPHTHLADILFKQRTLPHKPTHDQDISNLHLITDQTVVDEIISLS